MTTNAIDFATLAQQCSENLTDKTTARWLTLNPLYWAFGSLHTASTSLAKLQAAPGLDGLDTLIRFAADELDAVAAVALSIDIARVQADPAYAGSQRQTADIVSAAAGTAATYTAQLAKLVEAKASCGAAKKRRESLLDPERPKRKYLVSKHDFVSHDTPDSTRFHAGQHCEIDYQDEKGMRVANRSYSCFVSTATIVEHFDTVEM